MDTQERNTQHLEGADYNLQRMQETLAVAAARLGEFQKALRQETSMADGALSRGELAALRSNVRELLVTFHHTVTSASDYGLGVLFDVGALEPIDPARDIPTSLAHENRWARSLPDGALDPATEEDS